MNSVVSLKDYRRNKEAVIANTLDINYLKCWLNSTSVSKKYHDSFVRCFVKYIDNPKEINKYDVLSLLNGFSENKKVSKVTTKTIDCIFRLQKIKSVLDDEVNNKDMKVNKNGKHYVFRKATLHYFKAMLEFPDRITSYDIYMFMVCLRDSSDIDRDFFKDIAKAICKSGVNPKSKEEYNQSLLTHFINQPRFI